MCEAGFGLLEMKGAEGAYNSSGEMAEDPRNFESVLTTTTCELLIARRASVAA